jgi:hypothetical protein
MGIWYLLPEVPFHFLGDVLGGHHLHSHLGSLPDCLVDLADIDKWVSD